MTEGPATELSKRMMKVKKALQVLSVFLIFTTLGAKATDDSVLDKKIRYFENSDSLSKFVRDNSPHYWAYIKLHRNELGIFEDFNGQVVGDAHFGNFNFLPSLVQAQKEKVKAIVIDLDDGGEASLAADFVRFVVNTKAIDKDLRSQATAQIMAEAYIKGLTKEGIEKPNFVDEIKDYATAEGFEKIQSEYVDKHTVRAPGGLKFKLKPGVLEAFPSSQRGAYFSAAQKILKQVYASSTKLIDVAIRPRERGGSASALRFWVLYKDLAGKHFIREFKQIIEPGVSEYLPQPSTLERMDALQRVVFKDLRVDFHVVEVAGKTFWMRPKNIELVSVPYKPASKKDFSLLEDMMSYYGYVLGKIHGFNQSTASYVRAVTSNEDDFINMTESLSSNYLDLMKAKRSP